MSDRDSKHDLPTSFGVLKPVGHVVVGFADPADRDAARTELQARGVASADLVSLEAHDMASQLDAQLDDASGTAAFGYEIVLAQHYRELARLGHAWLIVYAPSEADSQQVAAVARAHEAELADRYGRLAVEQMLDSPTQYGPP